MNKKNAEVVRYDIASSVQYLSSYTWQLQMPAAYCCNQVSRHILTQLQQVSQQYLTLIIHEQGI